VRGSVRSRAVSQGFAASSLVGIDHFPRAVVRCHPWRPDRGRQADFDPCDEGIQDERPGASPHFEMPSFRRRDANVERLRAARRAALEMFQRVFSSRARK